MQNHLSKGIKFSFQTHHIKEGNNRLSLTFEKVKSVKKAKEVLEGVGE
jgi:hypothetical protein